MLMAGQMPPHFSFGLAKRETGRARSKEKKRFGGSGRMYADLLPPAGDGWRSRAAVRDGNVLPLGNPLARGDSGIPPAPIFAAAHTSVKDQEARSEAERAEREAGQMRSCTPSKPAIPPRDGSIGLAEDDSVPEGLPKSALAPIRQPPSARRATAPERVPAPFSFGPCTARFLFRKTEKKMGGAAPLDKPPWREPDLRGRRNGGPTVSGRPAHPATDRRNPPEQ